MTDARQRLRDYARETGGLMAYADPLSEKPELRACERGELAGLTFEALQDVLTYTEKLAAEGADEPSRAKGSGHFDLLEWGRKQAKREIAAELTRIIAARLAAPHGS